MTNTPPDEERDPPRLSHADCIEPSNLFELDRLRVRQLYAQTAPPFHRKPPQPQRR